MNTEQIKAIGNFITYYKTDLDYVKSFHDFKNDKISNSEYLEKNYSSFYTFLIEFKVMRNCSKNMVDKLLDETKYFITGFKPNDVDLFAKTLSLTNITHGKIVTSMASKILFLNNPAFIIPLDSLAKKSLNQKKNNYLEYKLKLNTFLANNLEVIEQCINFVRPLIDIIHVDYENKIDDLKGISKSRMIDKLLWTMGKN